MRSLLLASALCTAFLAGCVTPPAADIETAAALEGLLAAPTPLYVDPQNAPHPAFNWPTLVNPAQGDGLSTWWTPPAAAELPASITGIAHLAQTEGIPQGGGIAIFGSLAVVPGYSEVSYIVDISDPTMPKLLSEFEPTQGNHRGAAIVAFPDGRLATAISTGAGFEVWDITDPTKPVQAAAVETPNGGHKLGIVPGTPILYNAHSGGGENTASITPDRGQATTEIYDLTDPASPLLVQEFPNGFGCHHIYFWNSAEKQRAICAGIQFAQIWDTADPRDPVVIVSVPIPLGSSSAPSGSVVPIVTPFAHFSILNDDGTVLIVGDEMGGGSLPPGCTAPGAPTGALWFYDVTTETEPQLLGWYSPGHHLDPSAENGLLLGLPGGASCTAHHGRLVPDPEGRDLLAMSFYGAGVVLLDFSDPKLPQMVDQFKDGSNTWETWYYNGYLFTGDLNRGLDVLVFE